ncbi:MAG: glycosyltransferase family 4 protein [Pseudomonadota bacterium]
MRIVFHSRFPVNEDNPRGGVESATCNLLHGLHQIGYDDLHLVTLEKQRTEAIIERSRYATIHRLPAGPWPMLFDIFAGPGRARLKQYLHNLKPDVVHFHETHGLAMNNLGLPMVFTLHGFDTENLMTERKKHWRVRRMAWGIAERKGLSRQQVMISIAPYVRDKVRPMTEARIFDICNAIHQDGFKVERHENPNRVFFAGWINPRKNAAGLIRAFKLVLDQCPDAVLELAGEFSDAQYKAEVDATLAELNLGDSVQLLGRIPAPMVREKLSTAAMFVLPSFQENAPMVIAESMAAGVPVISSNLCGMPDMIDNGKTGLLIDPNNTRELADAMIRLLQSKEDRQRFSSAGKQSAIDAYHPEKVAAATIEVYQYAIDNYS